MPRDYHVCPWWIGYFLVNPLRRFRQDPVKLLSPYVRPGMRVLEIGPGMGYFTLALARMAGPQGAVVAVDIQEKMLAALRKRLGRAGLSAAVDTRCVPSNTLGVNEYAGRFDFALAFAVVHELPDQAAFFRELHAALKPGATVLMADPRGHFSREEYDRALALAVDAGLMMTEKPEIWGSRTAVLKKPE
ncbi:MAG: class I SAM-dependent methyltransferase [Chitinispirillaceae bacterium]|nr:class I SAM-dependent methyltransferase [Chitinispirillaceae bacterium]